jgi:hypothetical protein
MFWNASACLRFVVPLLAALREGGHMGNAWEIKVWRAFRDGEVTRDVLLCLPKFRGRGGLIFPSHEAVAKRAECCTKTVGRALECAKGLGLLGWIQRRKRAAWGTEQTSNLYTLNLENPAKQPDRQKSGLATQENLFFLSAMPDSADARASLARIVAERTKKAAQEWLAARAGGGNIARGMANATIG